MLQDSRGGRRRRPKRIAVVGQVERKRLDQWRHRRFHVLPVQGIARHRPRIGAVDHSLARVVQDRAKPDPVRVGDQLEGQAGNAIAEIAEHQILEHRQRQPAIGRRCADPLDRCDQRIERLSF